MSFGLTIGTERAITLQQSIQDELTKRGYSPDADPVMAEYITIMVINNKTGAQITSELEDLIGSEFDPSFTEWLFSEAAKGSAGPDGPTQPQESTSAASSGPEPPRDLPPHISAETSRRPPVAPRNGVYQQALSQVLPSTSPSAQKRSASARSPSPSHPNKSRRTDVPTGPRAMYRDGSSNAAAQNSRSLLDRVGAPAGAMRNGAASNGFRHDDIQARIDNIVNSSPDPNMMMGGGFPGMGGGMNMDPMAAAGMGNPLMLQEMMMNQMALMAQMASSMGMINPGAGQFSGPGFPMQGVMPGDMGMFPPGMNNGFQGGQQMGGSSGVMNGGGRGRGSTRGRGGPGRGRGGAVSTSATTPKVSEAPNDHDAIAAVAMPVLASPTPTPAASTSAIFTAPSASSAQRAGFVAPERPQSPTLCKFGPKCTNAYCRYSHPSPVATAESGVVLSNEACDKGKDCKDKDCIRAHVSPAALNPQVTENSTPTPSVPVSHVHNTPVPCRFGIACTRQGCTFAHPPRPPNNGSHFAQQCRFGAGCTRAACPFQHPEGRVLPTAFHRGLSTTGPMVNVSTPETGTMGGPSPHRSVKFNNNVGNGVREKLEKQMKEIEEKKSEAEKAVKEAEAAASKKDESKPVAIAA